MFIIVLLWLLIILIFLSIILYVPYNRVTLLHNSTLIPLVPQSGNYNLGIDTVLRDTKGYLQITLFLTTPDRMTFITPGSEKIVLKKGYNTFTVKTPCNNFQLYKDGLQTAGTVSIKEVVLYYK